MHWLNAQGGRPVAAQIAGILFATVLLAIVPPSRGKMMLVPIDAGARQVLVKLAVSNNARLVARGPLPSSMVIYGERAKLVGPMLKAGVLIMAAPSAGCGTDRETNA